MIGCIWLFFLSCGNTSPSKVAEQDSLRIDSITTHKITLLFAGDLMQHITQIHAAKTKDGYDYSTYFKYIKDEIQKADLAIANLEVTLGGKPYTGYPTFSAPDEYLFAIKDAGFDVLITANNHILDKGKKGLERTTLMLDSFQIYHAGSYSDSLERVQRYPLLIEKNGFRISFLNYTYGTNGLEPTKPNIVNYMNKETMAKDILTSKSQQPDVIIACMHWGDEYVSLPNKEQKEWADWLFSQGVTHIIGSHPHVVQPLEMRIDSITGNQNILVYSLGNFISNMHRRKTDGGILFKMELTKTNLIYVSDCGYSLVWTARKEGKRKNRTLIPVNFPADSLSKKEYDAMEVFIKDTRALFKKHHKGIGEYTFY